MLNQIRDILRNSTPADLAGDAIGAACVMAIPAALLFAALVL